MQSLELLTEPHRIEGVSLARRLELLLVGDGDDPAEPAPLLAATISL